MGLQSADFPNLFLLNMAGYGNFVRQCEPLVDWVTQCVRDVLDKGCNRIVPSPESEQAWMQWVVEAGSKMLRTQGNSWFLGSNIPGKARALLTLPDTAPNLRAKRAEIASRGYAGFVLK